MAWVWAMETQGAAHSISAVLSTGGRHHSVYTAEDKVNTE